MTSIEIKAEIFDILKEMEILQNRGNQLNDRKNELLKKLEEPKVG